LNYAVHVARAVAQHFNHVVLDQRRVALNYRFNCRYPWLTMLDKKSLIL